MMLVGALLCLRNNVAHACTWLLIGLCRLLWYLICELLKIVVGPLVGFAGAMGLGLVFFIARPWGMFGVSLIVKWMLGLV